MKWVPHPWGKCACILTRSLEVTECGKRSLFTNQTNYEKFKNLEHEFLKFSIHRDRKLIPEVVIVDAVKFNSISKVLWVLKLNQKKWCKKTWNEFWSCKSWQMKFACTSICNLRQCRKVEKGVDVFLQSCAQRCSIQAALEVSNHCAWNLRSMKFHSKVQSCIETKICAQYLKLIFRL